MGKTIPFMVIASQSHFTSPPACADIYISSMKLVLSGRMQTVDSMLSGHLVFPEAMPGCYWM